MQRSRSDSTADLCTVFRLQSRICCGPGIVRRPPAWRFTKSFGRMMIPRWFAVFAKLARSYSASRSSRRAHIPTTIPRLLRRRIHGTPPIGQASPRAVLPSRPQRVFVLVRWVQIQAAQSVGRPPPMELPGLSRLGAASVATACLNLLRHWTTSVRLPVALPMRGCSCRPLQAAIQRIQQHCLTWCRTIWLQQLRVERACESVSTPNGTRMTSMTPLAALSLRRRRHFAHSAPKLSRCRSLIPRR